MEQIKGIKTELTQPSRPPDIRQIDDTLALFFVDSQQQKITIVFNDVIAFKWDSSAHPEDEKFKDNCYELENSQWIATHQQSDPDSVTDGHHHYCFNFQQHGLFEILCTHYFVRVSN